MPLSRCTVQSRVVFLSMLSPLALVVGTAVCLSVCARASIVPSLLPLSRVVFFVLLNSSSVGSFVRSKWTTLSVVVDAAAAAAGEEFFLFSPYFRWLSRSHYATFLISEMNI